MKWKVLREEKGQFKDTKEVWDDGYPDDILQWEDGQAQAGVDYVQQRQAEDPQKRCYALSASPTSHS